MFNPQQPRDTTGKWRAINVPLPPRPQPATPAPPPPAYTNLNLSGTEFCEQNLTGTRFTGCDLTNADFTGCNLTGANFTDCDITGCDFTDTNLTGATFTRTDTSRAYRLTLPAKPKRTRIPRLDAQPVSYEQARQTAANLAVANCLDDDAKPYGASAYDIDYLTEHTHVRLADGSYVYTNPSNLDVVCESARYGSASFHDCRPEYDWPDEQEGQD